MVHIESISKTISSQGLAALYMDRVFRYLCVPENIDCDRDTRFPSLFLGEHAKRLETTLSMSTAYRPQTDGPTERVSTVLKDT